jgi:hypothetical protein
LRGRPVQLSKLGIALLPIFAQINALVGKAHKIARNHSRRRSRVRHACSNIFRRRQCEVLTGAAHRGRGMFQVYTRRDS